MLGAVVGGIASALAGGAASKLFGGKPAAQAATESSGLSNGQGVIGMDQDAGIQSAIQGSNVPNGQIPAPTQTGGVMSDAKNMIKNAGKDLLDGVMTAGSDRVKQALVDKLSGNNAKKQGQATRDYLAAAFPELNAWERSGAGASGAGLESSGQDQQKELMRMQLDTQKDIARMNNDTQKEIAGIQSATSRENTRDQVYAQNEMLKFNQHESQARVESILANTDLTAKQATHEIMRMALTRLS